jgi:CheY-like chemotaxis protein
MRKITILFTLLCCLSSISSIHAHLKIDSLDQVIKSNAGEKRIQLLCQYSASLINHQQLKDAQRYAEEALALAQNFGNQIFIAQSYENMGQICAMKHDYTNAIKYLLDAQRLRDNSKDYKAIASTKNMIGKVFLAQQDYNNALTQFTKSLEYWKTENNQEGIAETLKFLGDTYVGMKVYGKAKENYQQAMELLMAAEQHQKAADIASSLGIIVSELADYEGAITYYQTSLDLNTTTNNLPNISKDLLALSSVHLQQSNYDEAKRYAESALSLGKDLKDTLTQAAAIIIFGKIAADKGDKAQATTRLETAADILKTTALKLNTPQLYEAIATTFQQIGNLEKAMFYIKEYSRVKDAVSDFEKNKTMLDLTAKYESEYDAKQKQQQIELLHLEKSNNQKTIWLLIALALGAAIIGFLLFRNNKQRQHDNELLQVKNDEIVKINGVLDNKNHLLIEQQVKLQEMNEKLRHEMAERESMEKNSFDRDSFLVNITNQMRSPLNVISGLSHLLIEQNPQHHQIEHLRTLQFSANSLLVFINDMLDFSKIEAGKLTPETRQFEITKVLLEIKDRFSLPITNKGLQLKFSANEAIPTKLIGDPARLNQIVSNIMSFCLQNTQFGNIAVKFEAIPIEGKAINLEIVITDTSTGIPQYKMDELMRKFSYNSSEILDASQTTFGLSIMKRLVELQNGTVEASSVEGLGNKFRVVLPFKLTETKVVSLQQYDSKYSFPGAKILVVEDNKINSMVVVKMLQRAFAKVTTAENGEIALAKLEQDTFDLILMDIQMPIMDGYRATSEIRKLESEAKKNIPIIALTASPYLTETEKAQLFGMNDYIGKPFSPEELMEKISKFLINKEESIAV